MKLRELNPDQTRASWTSHALRGYQGVVKELGTGTWLWVCVHHHDLRRQALDCARRARSEGTER